MIKRGERIAQIVIAPVTQGEWRVVETLSETARGAGGFGSTGRGESIWTAGVLACRMERAASGRAGVAGGDALQLCKRCGGCRRGRRRSIESEKRNAHENATALADPHAGRHPYRALPAERRAYWRDHGWRADCASDGAGAQIRQADHHAADHHSTARGHAIIASFAGAEKHPAWYLDVKAAGRAELELGRERRQVRAEEVAFGGERYEKIWTDAVALYAPYASYKKRTTRQIPIVELIAG